MRSVFFVYSLLVGLPVKLANTGLYPFMITFVSSLIMQVSVVWLMVELLQRTDVWISKKYAGRRAHVVDPRRLGEGTRDPRQEDPMQERQPLASHDGETGRPARRARPDLHAMGSHFLGPVGKWIFDVSVMLHFVSILISYALAASMSYSKVMGVSMTHVIAPFVLIAATVIVFGHGFIQPVVSVLTFLKCSLLVFLIGVVGVVATHINLPVHGDWATIGEPFLLGTVALGGVVNIMPVVYEKVPFRASSMRKFRWAVTGGVILCWVLNLCWAAFVLRIVPQTDRDSDRYVEEGLIPEGAGHVSLEMAAREGDISTVPVIDVIDAGFHQYHWVSITVTAFIMLSVTVSFMTLGTGMKHVLDGIVRQHVDQAKRKKARREERQRLRHLRQQATDDEEGEEGAVEMARSGQHGNGWYGALAMPRSNPASASAAASPPASTPASLSASVVSGSSESPALRPELGYPSDEDADVGGGLSVLPTTEMPEVPLGCCEVLERCSPWCASEIVRRAAQYVFWFGLVLLIAQLNPSGFLVVLEVFTSLALNIESGFMVGLMFRYARWSRPLAGLRSLGRLTGQPARAQPRPRADEAHKEVQGQQEEVEEADQEGHVAAAAAPDAPAGTQGHHDGEEEEEEEEHEERRSVQLELGSMTASVLSWVVLIGFGFAAGYDVVTASIDYVGPVGGSNLLVAFAWGVWRALGWRMVKSEPWGWYCSEDVVIHWDCFGFCREPVEEGYTSSSRRRTLSTGSRPVMKCCSFLQPLMWRQFVLPLASPILLGVALVWLAHYPGDPADWSLIATCTVFSIVAEEGAMWSLLVRRSHVGLAAGSTVAFLTRFIAAFGLSLGSIAGPAALYWLSLIALGLQVLLHAGMEIPRKSRAAGRRPLASY